MRPTLLKYFYCSFWYDFIQELYHIDRETEEKSNPPPKEKKKKGKEKKEKTNTLSHLKEATNRNLSQKSSVLG